MWLFLAFVSAPVIEIALFIQVGSAIGTLNTLMIVVLTAILGTWLVRSQGMQTLGKLQRSFSELSNPAEPLAHGAMILFSGALLLTPGFFTDAVGFALLIPKLREAVFTYARKRIKVSTFTYGSADMQGQRENPRPGDLNMADPNVIDGEFTEVDPDKRPTHQPSGWTKH